MSLDEDFRDALREMARSFSAQSLNPVAARAWREDGADTAAVEAELAALGWLGVEVPEEHGGVGGGFGDLAILLHELGRQAAPVPFFATAVLGVGGLLEGSAEQRATWLPAIAAGEAVVTAALTGERGLPAALDVTATPGDGAWRLDGVAAFVPDLLRADAVLVAAGGDLFLVRTGAAGVARTAQPTVDQTRRLGRLALDGVTVEDAQRIGDGAADRLVERAALALAADGVGGAERVLELTVEHLQTRSQFGRPIGSFQALKHRCADMFLRLEASRAAVGEAVAAVDRGAPGPFGAIAKSYAGDAYVATAADGVQLHGGIGFTWEHDLHVYLKRARLNQTLYGDSAAQRARLAEAALAVAA
jgi:alkylation response protein AidB-like acyl-CoA dehydrogenase